MEATPQETERLLAFGERVAELRKQAGWSQEALADRAGMHRTYIWQVERGRRNLALKNIYKIADAFGVDIKELF